MLKRLRFTTPAMAVALLALFFALSGTAVAAGVVPLAKKALFAANAGKLQGRTAAEIAAQPGPALVTVRTAPFTLNPEQGQPVSVSCESGKKAIGGGFTSPSFVLSADTQVDGATFEIYLINVSREEAASGTAHAVCIG
jgi:hypothetical protein